MKQLNERLDAILSGEPSFYTNRVPPYLYASLKKGFGQRAYQKEAFGRFVYYLEEYRERPVDQPLQLLFHMATGSGKTVIMAGLIIYLYQQGYRNFLFFVNSSNIIEKTKDNFTNRYSSKYLFAENITIGEKRINIRVSENFESSNDDDITLVFTTIQGLHARLNTPRENAVTYEDFADKRTVLLSDEAHHINAETKKGAGLAKDEKEALVSWEGTVNRIFYANKANLLLEFTATIDFTVPEIKKKYADKLLFDYPLKQFRRDGYSKEVKILQTDAGLFERAVQALLLSQYRRKVFEKNKLRIKPVILFKSKTIRESQAFYAEFHQKLKQLGAHHLQAIRNKVLSFAGAPANDSGDKGDNVLQQAFLFFSENHLSPENLALELKSDFAEVKCIVVNSREESEQKQIAINTLEEEGNEHRAVFAVDKLNEGWDVLNLFDIVRLYDTRDAKGGKPGKTTVSEAQLIGRGARYCPFQVKPDQATDRRKFDDDLENEFRICEELYYHSAYNLRYIQELNTALVEIGIKPALLKECSVNVKETFKALPFYKEGYLFLNEQTNVNRKEECGLDHTVVHQLYKVRLHTGLRQASAAFDSLANQNESRHLSLASKIYLLSAFGVHVIRKAMSCLPFYRFANLKKILPNLQSISGFITSKNYLGEVKAEVFGLKEQIEILSQEDKLQVVREVLENMAPAIEVRRSYKWTKEFRPVLLKEMIKDKTVRFAVGEERDKERGRSMVDSLETGYYLNLKEKEWYPFNDCFGTAAEKKLILFFDKIYSRLKEDFNEVILVKNEGFLKLFDFESGRTIQPSFILFLVKRDLPAGFTYQIFIQVQESESHGQDAWKKIFLEQLKEGSQLEQEWQESRFFVGGLFFSEDTQRAFEEELNLLIKENEAVLKL